MSEAAGTEVPQTAIPTPADVASRLSQANNNQLPPTNQPQQQQQQQDVYGLSPYLERIPQALRGSVEPVFREYIDQHINPLREQFNQIEPYTEIINQYDPDVLQQAIAYTSLLEENPEGVLLALAESLGFDFDDEDDDSQIQQEYQLSSDPAFKEMQEQLAMMSDMLMGQHQKQQEVIEENAALDKVSAAFQKYGLDPDDTDALDFVLTKAAYTNDPDGAAKQFKLLTQRHAAQQNAPGQQAPVIMGAGGGQPVQQVNPRQWGSKDTESIVAQLLSATKNQT